MDVNDNLVKEYELFVDVCQKMQDPELEECLNEVIRIFRKPDLLPTRAAILIQKLQATATLIGVRKQWYTAYGPKTPEGKFKKNMYYTLEERLDRMVDALKFVIKA